MRVHSYQAAAREREEAAMQAAAAATAAAFTTTAPEGAPAKVAPADGVLVTVTQPRVHKKKSTSQKETIRMTLMPRDENANL